jgi:hypothetical protein
VKKYCEGKVKRTLKRGLKALEIVIRKAYAAIDCSCRVQRARQRRCCFVDCKRLRGDCRRSLVRLCLAGAYQRQVGRVYEGGSKVLRRVRSLGTYRFFFRHSPGLVYWARALAGVRGLHFDRSVGGSSSARAAGGYSVGQKGGSSVFTLVKRYHTTRLETRTKESNMYASLRMRNSGAKRKRNE